MSRGGDLRDAVAMLKDLTTIANAAGGESGPDDPLLEIIRRWDDAAGE